MHNFTQVKHMTINIHIRMWIRYTHLCIYIYICIYMFLCLSIYLHSYLCIRSPCTYLHIHVCMCKKASDCNICFAGPMGHFSSYHKSLYFFVALRNPPFPHESTDAQRHRSERHKTNMQAAVPTQNKYAST